MSSAHMFAVCFLHTHFRHLASLVASLNQFYSFLGCRRKSCVRCDFSGFFFHRKRSCGREHLQIARNTILCSHSHYTVSDRLADYTKKLHPMDRHQTWSARQISATTESGGRPCTSRSSHRQSLPRGAWLEVVGREAVVHRGIQAEYHFHLDLFGFWLERRRRPALGSCGCLLDCAGSLILDGYKATYAEHA